jgi:plasmid stabilization system protein ParE
MGNYKTVHSIRAKIDLQKIFNYYAKQVRPDFASNYVGKIKKAANALSSSPYRGRVVDAARGLRRQNVKGTSHFILYTIDERRKFVIVMYVFHNKEDWPGKL